MKKYKVYISGRVQGVGFRFTTLRLAQELNDIYGFVTNLDDGRVYMEIAGKEKSIRRFLDDLGKYASPMARIDKIQIIENDLIKIRDSFSVR